MRRDAFIGYASQRRDMIGCRKTGSVGAQRVRDACTQMRLFTLVRERVAVTIRHEMLF